MIYKIANAPILATDVTPTDRIASWRTTNVAPTYVQAEQGEWNFDKRDGMMYVAVRAVSVGTNGNADHFEYDELKKSYKTFIGKGVFVNHASSDVEKKRGIIVDARWIETGGDKYVVCLLEVNQAAYPEFCQMIRSGQINSVSMGVQVGFSECSICANKAKTIKDYCLHVKMHKGGAYNGKPVYEINRELDFIEVSFVTVGADSQAKVLEVFARQNGLDFRDVLDKFAAGKIEIAYDDTVNFTDVKLSISNAIMQGIRRAASKIEDNK